MGDILRAEGVSRSFQAPGGLFWALRGITMSAGEGALTILKGRSGSGKTTLMNILGALDAPTKGEVFFRQSNLTQLNEKGREAIRRTDMGFVFQSVALVSMMTAYENVEFGLRIAGCPAKGRRERAELCLALVGLSQRMGHMPQELSGGEQQRVAIAHRPKVIFADEPTAELDMGAGLQVVKIFKDLARAERTAIVMTTHDPGLMDVADRLYELEDGELASGRGV